LARQFPLPSRKRLSFIAGAYSSFVPEANTFGYSRKAARSAISELTSPRQALWSTVSDIRSAWMASNSAHRSRESCLPSWSLLHHGMAPGS